MGSEKNRSDDELRNLYEHRYEAGYYFFYSSLSQEDKERYESISAEEDVKKWRKEGKLIGKLLCYGLKEKHKDFIDLDESIEVFVRRWIIKRILDMKSGKRDKKNIQNEVLKISQDSKNRVTTFLKEELQNSASKNYVSEINDIISWLQDEKGKEMS